LAVSIRLYKHELAKAPVGCPENSLFFRPTTKGLIVFSSALLSLCQRRRENVSKAPV
jgi:hypothetical protein